MPAGVFRLPSVIDVLSLLDALPASVALWDRDVRLRYGNERALTRFGPPVESLLGVHLSDVVQAHAVELSAQYIDGALAGQPQQVERAMVDADGQRFNAHQVTHIPNVVDGVVRGYCALAVDITASIEGYEQARRARERQALEAERARIAGDLGRQVDDLASALHRLDAALDRAVDAVPSLRTAADAIERTIGELRATVPARLHEDGRDGVRVVAFPGTSALLGADPAPGPGVPWPAEITGRGWSAEDAVALLDLLPAAVVWTERSGRVAVANRAAVRLFGRDDISGADARDLLGPELVDATLPFALAALRGRPQHFDRTVRQPDGLRHLQVSYLPAPDGGLHVFAVDVTARVEAELALQDARAELARSRERSRIADELHNQVIQRLFVAGLAASSVASAVDDAQLRSVQDGIVGALADLDHALTALQESVGSAELLPNLAQLVADTTKPYGIASAIENVGSVDYVPPLIGAEVLAVAEAALSNVARHARASSVVVTIAADGGSVWLRVADDGRGIGPSTRGEGMTDMAARAARLGGTCTWRPGEPRGTVVDWRVPTT